MSTNLLNPFEIFAGEVPIMSFQTDKNGTFNPSFVIASGTLRWVIDGEEQITNSPSKALTGATVDVEVFANTVAPGAVSTATLFFTQNIIGELDFRHFVINGTYNSNDNSDLDSLKFSASGNVSQNWQSTTCPSLTSVDLNSFTMTDSLQIFFNSSLIELINPTYSPSLANYNVLGSAFPDTELDLILSSLNTDMSASAPTSDLTLDLRVLAGVIPTGGSSNTDLVNLRDVVYPNAGFTFTPLIN